MNVRLPCCPIVLKEDQRHTKIYKGSLVARVGMEPNACKNDRD